MIKSKSTFENQVQNGQKRGRFSFKRNEEKQKVESMKYEQYTIYLQLGLLLVRVSHHRTTVGFYSSNIRHKTRAGDKCRTTSTNEL